MSISATQFHQITRIITDLNGVTKQLIIADIRYIIILFLLYCLISFYSLHVLFCKGL